MFLLRIAAVILTLGGACAAAQGNPAPPKELVQYVKDASRLGLTAGQIRQNAVKAGWPAGVVDAAIAAASGKAQPEPSPEPRAEEPKKQEPKEEPKKEEKKSPPVEEPKVSATPATPAETPVAATEARTHGVPDDYRIGAGDVLQVSVYKEPEASVPSVVVRPDGKIGLPLLKEVEVIGLTPIEAEKLITTKLTKLIPAADVAVVVTAIHSKKIYVVGAVKKEGPIPYTYRMTVMQALSEAGGLTDYARKRKIYVLRNQNGKEYRLPFDYDAVLRGERMELNIPLMANDTLVIPH